MRFLIVTPDYASHYYPMSAVAEVLRARGHDVVIATGPTLADRVRADGFEHRELVLGPGANPGLIRPGEQPVEEASRLRAFLDATRAGMVATLRHQAESRLRDLLWRPMEVTAALREIVSELRPTLVVSDQLAFGATLALRALEQPYVSFHPGHPSAIPGPGEVFGFPARRPSEFAVQAAELAELKRLCGDVSRRFTRVFNAALLTLNPDAAEVASALSATSPLLTLLNYPAELAGYRRALLPRGARFIGASMSHNEPAEGAFNRKPAETSSRPRIYVSFGSFLSARGDVLRRVVDAFRDSPAELIVASGVTPPFELGTIREGWRVEPFLPQQELLPACDLVICHGGNNTVTEALSCGVPLLVAPFSTDQFAGAEDVRRAGLGDVFDPNTTTAVEIGLRARRVLEGGAPRHAAQLGERLRAVPGPALAADLIEQAGIRTTVVASGGRSSHSRPRPIDAAHMVSS